MIVRLAVLVAGLGLLCGCGGSNMLKTEPLPGELGNSKVVLVDDGQCPKGQVHRVVGPASLTSSRTYSCVAKP